MRLGLVIVGCVVMTGCARKPVRTHLVSQPTPVGFIAQSPAVSEDGRWIVFDQEGRESDVGIRHRDQGMWHANRDGFKWKAGTPDGNRGTDPDITADGQWMVFVTDAPLKPQDRNHLPDVYAWRARDTNHNSLELISVSRGGGSGNGQVYGPAKISPDGRYVVWTSNATDYVGRNGDPDGPVGSVFIRDRQLDITRRLPVTDDYAGAATHVENVDFAMTEDGVIYLAVETGAGLVNDDSNGERDVYAIAIQPEVLKLPEEKGPFRQHAPAKAGAESLWTVELVSVGPDKALGDNKSYGGHVLLPAKHKAAAEFLGYPLVVFTSEARTLTREGGDFEPDVFVQAFDPRYSGLSPLPPRQVSSYIDENEKGKCVAGDAENLDNGDIVIAMTCRGPLVREDGNHIQDVYVRTLADAAVLASRPDPDMTPKEWTKGPPKKQLGNAPSFDPDLSMDGCHVAFASESRNLSDEYDDDPHTEVFARYNPMRWKKGVLRRRCGWAPRDQDE